MDFASEEIKPLAEACRTYCAENIRVEQRWRTGGQLYDVFVHAEAAVPMLIRSRTGMILNEVRSILDALACTLATRNKRTPSGVYFPVGRDRNAFEEALNNQRKIAAEDREILAGVRAYPAGNRLLYGLHDADRKRKHQRLGAVGAVTGSSNIGLNAISLAGGGGARLLRCNFNGIYVEDLTVFSAREMLEAKSEGPAQMISGCPRGIDITFNLALAFEFPEEFVGHEVSKTLRDTVNEVRRVVGLFR